MLRLENAVSRGGPPALSSANKCLWQRAPNRTACPTSADSTAPGALVRQATAALASWALRPAQMAKPGAGGCRRLRLVAHRARDWCGAMARAERTGPPPAAGKVVSCPTSPNGSLALSRVGTSPTATTKCRGGWARTGCAVVPVRMPEPQRPVTPPGPAGPRAPTGPGSSGSHSNLALPGCVVRARSGRAVDTTARATTRPVPRAA